MEPALATMMRSGAAARTPAFAAALDAADELAPMRAEFRVPPRPASSSPSVYLCGNSLGLQPVRARAAVAAEMDKWAALGVEGHFTPPHPWLTASEGVAESLARLVGARPTEVTAMGSLSANLHALLTGFYRPSEGARRCRILLERGAFPSDAHVALSQVLLHGKAPHDTLLHVAPREGEDTIRTEDIIAAIREAGDTLALVLLPGVQYYTGQLFDIPAITAAAHSVGAIAGWDLAHAAGNVPLHLHDWDVDFAAWCTYKYMNTGPGGIAGFFVHDRFAEESLSERPRFAGWWGHRREDRFLMAEAFVPIPGAAGWALSNPPVLCVATLRASLEVFDAAGGMAPLRAKSLALTRYLELLLHDALGREQGFRVITPADPEARGAQLSLNLPGVGAGSGSGGPTLSHVRERLAAQGVIVDTREPAVLRVAPAPLYNSAADVLAFVDALVDTLRDTGALGSGGR